MSEIDEIALEAKIKGMSPEEREIVAQTLPDFVLWNEIQRRFYKARAKIEVLKEVANKD